MVLASNDKYLVSLASSTKIGDFWWDQTRSLGWNRSHADHETHWISSEGSYLVLHPNSPSAESINKSSSDSTSEEPSTADIDPEAEPLGIILAIPFANKTGWLGSLVVAEPHRGNGGGALLLDAAVEYLKSTGVNQIGLDSVKDQAPMYKRRGFEPTGTVKVAEREPLGQSPMVPEEGEGPLGEDSEAARVWLSKTMEQMADVRGVTGQSLLESDKSCTGLERRELWLRSQALIDREDAWGLAVTRLDDLDDLRSWVLVRDCEEGYRVGPMYARTKLHALILLRAVMAKIAVAAEGSQKRLTAEVWAENPDAFGVFARLGWQATGIEHDRMWLKGDVPEAQAKGGKADREAYAWFDAVEG
ncbi:hypothetical protein IWX90DRAFT_154330 [Phyllosticta citrichinensis]|uniref:N-acetyltransferase domain-containing protein n=1 Tax=Phyllosticta citrichinensis TaxID=1130410 RepID=A0ABR1XZS7_9PEZI